MRPRRNRRVCAAGRLFAARTGSRADGMRGRLVLRPAPVPAFVQLFRKEHKFLAILTCSRVLGIDSTRTGVGASARAWRFEQRDRRSILPVGANGEKPPVPNETKGRCGKQAGNRASLPKPRIKRVSSPLSQTSRKLDA